MTETQELEIVNDLPAVAERNFFSALEKMEYSKQKLAEIREAWLLFQVTDKESAKEATKKRIEIKNIRVELEKRAKEIRKPLKDAGDVVSSREHEYTDPMKELEKSLEKKVDEFEEKIAREKREAAEKEMLRYTKRVQELTLLGVLGDGNNFRLDDMVIDGELVKGADDDIYQETIYLPFKALFDKHEAERLEKERIEQERRDLWEKQQAEMEEQRKKFAEEKRLYEEQQQKRREAEFQSRLAQLTNIGLSYNGQYESFVFEDINVHKVDISTYDEAAWTRLINALTPLVTERKAAAEKKKQEEKEAQERYEARRQQVVMLGFAVNTSTINGFKQEFPNTLSACSNEEFDAILDRLAHAKADWDNSERERIKQEIIAEEKRQLELAEQQRIAKLEEGKDKAKWEDTLAHLLKTPVYEMRSQQYRIKMKMVRDFLADLQAMK